MLNYPLSVFIDTNIFVGCKYDLSDESVLKILEKFSKNQKVNLHISNVVLKEIEKHIKDDIDNVFNSFKSAKKEAMKKISPKMFDGTSFAQYFAIPLKEDIEKSVFIKFYDFLNATNMIVLDNEGVKIDLILEDYFNNCPPFEKRENKKNEFPDAIIAAKLKEEFSSSNPVWIVSGDKGFQSVFDGLKGFNCIYSLKELFDLINRQDKMYDSIVKYLENKDVIEEISSRIKEKLESDEIEIDGMDCDRKGYCEGFEYTETLIETVSDVEVCFSSVDDISEDSVTVSVLSSVVIEALCTYDDFDNSIWDSEEKEYMFLDEVKLSECHEAEFECSLKFLVHSEGDKTTFELSEVSYDLFLDQGTRLERIIVIPEDPRLSAEAEMMDALEEYHKH